MKNQQKKFTTKILKWHREENVRSLPWKGEADPYKIWLSEIILQQTRADQGLNYYLKFTELYPTICDLANAADDDVFLHWQGLGYYNRCRNMLATARFICSTLNGTFPEKYEDILALKGVGAYTAAAISSFAFGLPHAVLDGNVYRVLSRFWGIEEAIDSSAGKLVFAQLADTLLDKKYPAEYNQAIMDFGATVCKPKNPLCSSCIFSKDCAAFQQDLVLFLPIKEKKLRVQNRYFNFLVLMHENKVWIEQRMEKGIWQNLHQFYLIETAESIDIAALQVTEMFQLFSKFKSSPRLEIVLKQRLTHQLIESKIYFLSLNVLPKGLPENGFWVDAAELKKYAFPKTLVSYLETVSI